MSVFLGASAAGVAAGASVGAAAGGVAAGASAGLAASGVLVSVDTRHATTMEAALDAGASVVNDISGLTFDPRAASLVASRGCPVVLMHMRGEPADMHTYAHYDDVVTAVCGELTDRALAAEAAGVARGNIALDPGIGFAKTARHSMELLRRMPETSCGEFNPSPRARATRCARTPP